MKGIWNGNDQMHVECYFFISMYRIYLSDAHIGWDRGEIKD